MANKKPSQTLQGHPRTSPPRHTLCKLLYRTSHNRGALGTLRKRCGTRFSSRRNVLRLWFRHKVPQRTQVATCTPRTCHLTRWFVVLLLVDNSRWRLLLIVVVGAVGSRIHICVRSPNSTYKSPVMHRRLRYLHQAIIYTVGVPPHAYGVACCCCWAACSQRCAPACLLYSYHAQYDTCARQEL